MADVIRYVNAASAAGGDGTTNATSGANRAWSGIDEAITAAGTSKSTSDRWLVYVEGTTAETLAAAIAISTAVNTTSANPIRFIDVSPAATWSTSRYRLIVPSGVQFAFDISAGSPFLEFEGVQIEHQRNLASFPNVFNATLGTGRLLLDRCYVRFTGSTATPASDCAVVRAFGNTAYTVLITNCMAVDTISLFAPNYSNAATVAFGNNTVLSHDVGIQLGNLDTGATINVHNNLVDAIAGTCFGAPAASWTTAGNVSSDATSPQTALRNLTATFVDRTGRDLRLASGDTTAQNAGTDISAISAYSGLSVASDLDIAGTTRPQGAAWDIGAFEVVAAGGAPVVATPSVVFRRARDTY